MGCDAEAVYKIMGKIKITSFEKEGVRDGRALESVLSELGIDVEEKVGGNLVSHGESKSDDNDVVVEEKQILQICRLSFTSTEKARAMCKLILSREWTRIVLEKTSGRFVSLVLQAVVVSTRTLEVKQHQRYDGIRWNFGLDWFPKDSPCPLEQIHFTGVRFRGGEELKFFHSLADLLKASATSTNDRPIGLRVLELNACRFLHPEIQHPILLEGLKIACFETLERLWMPKSPGLDDDRFEELFGQILQSRHDQSSCIVELGFSYNGCGWKGSRAVCSFLEAPQSANLKVLYLNRQHGELDLQGILRAAAGRPGKFHLNLSQNYVSSYETLQQLRDVPESRDQESNDCKELNLNVQLDSMTFEVPEAVIPGNGSNKQNTTGRKHQRRGGKDGKRQKSFEEHVQNLSQEEIAKLNVACGRVKYVLGRAAAAFDRNNESSTKVSPLNPATSGEQNGGSDWFFSSLAALDCVLPDLLSILRLQKKQNDSKSEEDETTIDPQHPRGQNHQRQYRNWLPTFLRKSVKGNINILKPWLLSASQRPNSEVDSIRNDVECGQGTTLVVTESEQQRLKTLWDEIEALHTNIAYHTGRQRRKHATENNSGESPTLNGKTKRPRKKKQNRKSLAEIPMTPEENPLVQAAYESIPLIPTAILESSDESSSFLSLPMDMDGVNPASDSIQAAIPVFIDTVEDLENLRKDLFRKAPPYKLPKMVAVDSEWYFVDNPEGETQHSNSTGGRPKKVKHRSMSVATLQIAYVDENETPMILRSFVIDLLSDKPGFQKLAKECVSWLFGSASCDMTVLGFAFGGDLRQLRKYAGIGGYNKNGANENSIDSVAPLEAVASRCLDIQNLLASPEDIRMGRVPGLKKCAHFYFQKALKKDDQTSDWRERPLRRSQLEYAALDAVILLVLLSQKKREYYSSGASSRAVGSI